MDKTIEALEKLVQIKDETIKELEKQIQLLKNNSIPQPITTPSIPHQTLPWQPNYINPIGVPFISPPQPPFWTISGSNSVDLKITSDQALPPGSIQMNTPNPTSGYIQTSGIVSNLNLVPNTNSNVTYIQKTGC